MTHSHDLEKFLMKSTNDRADSSKIKTVGVIGAGQMGSGIAQVCAAHKLDVFLSDQGMEEIEQSIKTIRNHLDRQHAKGRLDLEERDSILARLKPVQSMADFNHCDLVIEAASENEGIKQTILKDLIPHLAPHALIATNTSSLSITRLAAITDRADRFIGMHFMNPVPMMKLVELIRGMKTTDDTFESIRHLAVQLGKSPVTVQDFPAFIINRILLPMINEAIYALHEGVGDVEAIDTSLKLGAHHPMGPLELADFIGLDTCLAIMRVLYDGLCDSKYRPCPLLVKYVEAGWLGRKSGQGFYDYASREPVPTRIRGR